MSTRENLIESIVSLINSHFDLNVELGEENLPVVTQATPKQDQPLTQFVNQFIQLVENSDCDGKMNYYFGNELDFDSNEEFHRW
ncbi:hypothetical protein [Brevibacillus dissolubilis]|uniref:hypothetical protein n=1 Tax=Brevibacillus dissolubilis TaxID=1844116 RepID=UPI001115EA73|nr:hypothetical protein [Brevibacillus dissolubilis]